jgi:hypothetical protein
MREIQGKLPVYPVQGKVTFNGQPIAGAFLMFHPIDKLPQGSSTMLPRARTGEDGSFGVSTYAVTDGAPAGRYRVTVSWKGTDEASFSQEQRDELPERLPTIYQTKRTTRLWAEVKEEDNVLPTYEISDPRQASTN